MWYSSRLRVFNFLYVKLTNVGAFMKKFISKKLTTSLLRNDVSKMGSQASNHKADKVDSKTIYPSLKDLKSPFWIFNGLNCTSPAYFNKRTYHGSFLLNANTGNDIHFANYFLICDTKMTVVSVTAKAAGINTFELGAFALNECASLFDLDKGEVLPNSLGAKSPISCEILSLGDGWFKCSVVGIGSGLYSSIRLYLSLNGSYILNHLLTMVFL